jgi:hypothetical protein
MQLRCYLCANCRPQEEIVRRNVRAGFGVGAGFFGGLGGLGGAAWGVQDVCLACAEDLDARRKALTRDAGRGLLFAAMLLSGLAVFLMLAWLVAALLGG